MSLAPDSLNRALDALLVSDADALDSKDMARWLSNYAEEDAASYICLSAENEEQGLALGFMYDDCRARLLDRVTYITQIWAGTFQDYRTRHFVQRVATVRIDDQTWHARSNFSVFMTPEDSGVSEVLATGRYEDVVRESAAGELRLLSRRALLDTTVLPRYLVYPI